jgi:hypothetical protein
MCEKGFSGIKGLRDKIINYMVNLDIINEVIFDYFERNKSVSKVQAKKLMPQFIKAGIFISNQKDGLPIRKVLRDLDEKNKLHLIPYALAERKEKNTSWYFVNTMVEK